MSFFFNSATELVPPTLETRRRLIQEVLTVLQEQRTGHISENIEDPENLDEVAARTLFNTIIYLHPFGDGNGRTARTLYYAFSPHIRNKSSSDLARRLIDRPKSLREYHQLLNQSTFEEMLEDHDINWMFTQTPRLPIFETGDPARGFDANHLRFIAAFDAMTDEEKDLYIHNDHGMLVINQESLPPEMEDRINVCLEKVREEFIDSILEFSVYPRKWPDWLQEPFTNAFKESDTSETTLST